MIRALNSSSVQVAHKPVGGMAFIPFLTDSTRVSMPFSRRDSQASTSPVLGAPAAPETWQAAQALWYLSVASAAETAAEKLNNNAIKTDFIVTSPLVSGHHPNSCIGCRQKSCGIIYAVTHSDKGDDTS